MKNHRINLFLLIITFFTGCSEADEDEISSLVSKIVAFDVGNDQSGSDIRVSFDLASPELNEFWMVVNKEDNQVSIDAIKSLPDNQVQKYTLSPNESRSIKLTTITQDTGGENVRDNTPYTLQVYTPQNNKVTIPSDPFSLSSAGIYDGEYVGTWSDNLYTNFGISAILFSSGNTVRGNFFYSGNFTSCCGGSNDGGISFTVEGSEIVDVTYGQSVGGFTGVNGTFYDDCPGFYEGEGTIANDILLNISFEGEDCEGPHTGGQITFRRVK